MTITKNTFKFFSLLLLMSILLLGAAKCHGPIGGPEWGPSEQRTISK